jgi:transposase
MRQKSVKLKEPAEKVVKDIRRATRKRHSSEEKIRERLDTLFGNAGRQAKYAQPSTKPI